MSLAVDRCMGFLMRKKTETQSHFTSAVAWQAILEQRCPSVYLLSAVRPSVTLVLYQVTDGEPEDAFADIRFISKFERGHPSEGVK